MIELDSSRREKRRQLRSLVRRRHLYHTVVYNAPAAGVNTTNLDFAAAADTEFTARNSHYTLSEPYNILGASLVGASVLRGRYQVPRWNNFGELAIFSANRALTATSNPQWDDYRFAPLPLPLEEEIQVQVSNNLGAATEQESAVLNLGTPDWNTNIPPGVAPMGLTQPLTAILQATFTLTPTINVWSGGQVLAFTQSLLGGVWSVIGGVVQGANAVAWRIIFPRNRLYNGRRLRPGGLVQTAAGDIVNNAVHPWILGWGELGRFHTFEFPTVEVFGATAASTTYRVFFWLRYLGSDRSLLDQWLIGGS